MTGERTRFIRDPVHNLIPFHDDAVDRLLLSLINTREFQRLRRIKQLGFSEMVFPGANHTRFAHSIGVMNFATRMLQQIKRLEPKLTMDQISTVRLAALLHDIGHGPFSHAFEKITETNHELWTIRVILDESTEVNRVLRAYSRGLPQSVAAFFEDGARGGPRGFPRYLIDIVHSQLDADRFDYLLRDCHATGTGHGGFDVEWLLGHLRIDSDRQRLYLEPKALSAAEEYVHARYHMYKTVYFHKTTRSAEVILKGLFQCYKDRLAGARSAQAKSRIVPHLPPAIVNAFGGNLSLAEYLELDDYAITGFFKECAKSRDPILADLGPRLVSRRLFKCIQFDEGDSSDGGKITDFHDKAKDAYSVDGRFDRNYYFGRDTPSDVPYKPYNPDDTHPAAQIYIGKSELSQVSGSVRDLTRRYKWIRYYFPEELRHRMHAAFQQSKG